MFDGWSWYDWFPGLESDKDRMLRRAESGRNPLPTYNEDAQEVYDHTLDDPEWVASHSWIPPIGWWQDYRRAQDENRYWRDWYKNQGLDPNGSQYPWYTRKDLPSLGRSSALFGASQAVMALYRRGRQKW